MGSDRILTPEEVRARIMQYENLLPSIVVEDLEKTLTSMKLPEYKIDEILQKTVSAVEPHSEVERVEEMTMKLDSLESELAEIIKYLQNTQHQRVEQQISKMREEPAAVVRERKNEEKKEEGGSEKKEAPKERPKLFAENREEAPLVLLSEVREDMVSKTVLLKWVEFLISKVGKDRLPYVLDYYLDIGWINEEIIMKVLAYAKGLEGPKRAKKSSMTTDEHLRSLLYIEKLKGKNIDHNMILQIKRMLEYEVERRNLDTK